MCKKTKENNQCLNVCVFHVIEIAVILIFGVLSSIVIIKLYLELDSIQMTILIALLLTYLFTIVIIILCVHSSIVKQYYKSEKEDKLIAKYQEILYSCFSEVNNKKKTEQD